MQKVSFIVPVYNVKPYLKRCVESIAQQNVDTEIILVDDGSTDGSGELAEQLAKDSACIRVIHRENGGLSAARNTGLKAAVGEYVLFVDSDDWLIPDTVGKLIDAADQEQLDVGVADFQEAYENGQYKPNMIAPISSDVVTGAEYLLKSLREKHALMMVWKSIYRRKFLLDNELFFREGYNHEDEEWSPRVYLKARRVKSIDCVFYNYLIRCSGIARQPEHFRKNSLDMVSNCYELKKLADTVENQELRDLLQNNTACLFLSAVYKGKLIDKACQDTVNSGFFRRMNLTGKTKRKVQLFKFNKQLYYYVNAVSKVGR